VVSKDHVKYLNFKLYY